MCAHYAQSTVIMEEGNQNANHQRGTCNTEFVVDRHKVLQVKDMLSNVNHLFGVTLELRAVFSGAEKSQQWISISGSDMKTVDNAKAYTLALVAPETTMCLLAGVEHMSLTRDNLDELERSSQAHLFVQEETGHLIIQGTDLSVVTAQSMFDVMLMLNQSETEKNNTQVKTLADPSGSELREREAHLIPQTAFSMMSAPSLVTQVPTVNQSTPTYTGSHRARAIPVSVSEPYSCQPCGRIEPSALTHHSTSSSQYSLLMEGHQDTSTNTSNTSPYLVPCDRTTPSTPIHTQTCGYERVETPEIYGAATSIHAQHPNQPSQKALEQQDYLISLGLYRNFSMEEAKAALTFFDMNDVVVPSEYLDKLKTIKSSGDETPENKQKLSSLSETSVTPQGISENVTYGEGRSSNTSNEVIIVSDEEMEADTVDGRGKELCKAGESVRRKERFGNRIPVCTNPPNKSGIKGSLPGSNGAEKHNDKLRYIVIDGSNVAMSHGDNKVFSSRGLQICINYFCKRGHDKVVAFVSESVRYSKNVIYLAGRKLLEQMHDEGLVKFTPARRVNGKTIAAYDDRFILNLALMEDAVVVSNDQFRDLCQEDPKYLQIVEHQLLQYVFADDHFMPPDDPLGRNGPTLDDFLRKSPPRHARGKIHHVAVNMTNHQWVGGVTSKYVEKTRVPTLVRDQGMSLPLAPHNPSLGPKKRWMLDPNPSRSSQKSGHMPQQGPKRVQQENSSLRSWELTNKLLEQLTAIFSKPEQLPYIKSVLQNHSNETDIHLLTNYCINAMPA